jgi:DNA-directed RNA polymerase specialized sigma24 family protein
MTARLSNTCCAAFRTRSGVTLPEWSGHRMPMVYRIASRQAFRHLQNERRWPDGTTEALVLDDMPAKDIRPSTELLRELLSLDELSAPNRAVLALHFQEELTLVASILELPLGTVKSRLAYGLSAILTLILGHI